MPTRNRRPFVRIAICLFAGQDYESRELIVVDDGEKPVQDLLQGYPWIRYIRLPEVCSIGQKRNIACRQARGEIIAHWDDDDWYAHDRLSVQVQPILEERADITGLEMGRVLQLPEGDFWTITRALHSRMFVGDVHGGTLMFRRSLVSENINYPEINLAEDARFLADALRCNKRLERVSNDGNLFTYVRHGSNAWDFCAGRFMNRRDWLRTGTPEAFPPERVAEYQAAAKAASEDMSSEAVPDAH